MRKALITFLVAGMIMISFIEATFADPTHTAENYPKKAIKMITDVSPGGATDTSCRIVSKFLSNELGVPVIVVNMEGGGGQVGGNTVRTEKPDGYTLLYTHTKIHINFYAGKSQYEYTAFSPIATTAAVNETILVDSKSPWNSLNDLVKDAKANPGKFIFGVQLGSLSDALANALQTTAGIRLKLVDSGDEAGKLTAMLSGNLHIIMSAMGSAVDYVKAGKMKCLAVASEERDSLAPDFPTAKEQGYNIVFPAMHTIYAPKGIPADVANKLSNALKYLSSNKDMNEKLKMAKQVYQWRSIEGTEKYLQSENAICKAAAATAAALRKR